MAPALLLERLDPVVAARISPFVTELLTDFSGIIHSVHVVGSAVTPDYNEKTSDINSLIVLNEMDFGFIRSLAATGKKYKKKAIAAPLIMTPRYIRNSLDVFPVEFLDLRLIHKTLYGEDILKDLPIDKPHLRIQCEREIKTRLIGLRQGYVSTLNDERLLAGQLSQSIVGYIPLFRAVIYLMGKEPPVPKRDVIDEVSRATGIEMDTFMRVLRLRQQGTVLPKKDIPPLFENYYNATERLGAVIDGLQQ